MNRLINICWLCLVLRKLIMLKWNFKNSCIWIFDRIINKIMKVININEMLGNGILVWFTNLLLLYGSTGKRYMLHGAQKMKFSIKELLRKCDQIHRKLQIWSHLRKKWKTSFFVQWQFTSTHGSNQNYLAWTVIFWGLIQMT